MSSDSDQLYKIRHSLAHIMAQAVLQIRPDAKLGFGPAVDNGFYYDFDFGNEHIHEIDLKQIEKRMLKIIKKKQPFEVATKSLEEGAAMLDEMGQTYKSDYIKELAESGEELSFYSNGPFVDLCEGPHLEHTGEIAKGSFSLDKIAGSYWRGDEKNPMLTRIYGLAFETPDQLKEYKKLRELAKQRDHRKLGTELELYSLSENIGGGLVLWHPNGARIRNSIEEFWRKEHYRNGYELLYTPHVGLAELWKTSGHLDFYSEGMYAPLNIDDRDFYMKPMNCPFHIEIYQQRHHSYKELPKRWAELGTVYRYEKSGVLNGLLRVRGFTQDDAHIICTPDQIEDEITEVLGFCLDMLKTFGFEEFKVYLATKPEKSVGHEKEWDQALVSLEKAVKRLDLDCEVDEGGGAFYGPKIDLKIKDALGREWQCSTIQFDFNLPSEERFNLFYVGEDGTHHRPYMVHRALLGSIERFFALLVEHYGGAFPTWLAPTQVRLAPIGEFAYEYAKEVKRLLQSELFSVEIDTSNDSFNKKIRKAVTSKTPNIWIIGGDEAENRTITWRRYCTREQKTVGLDDAIQALKTLCESRTLDNKAEVQLPIED
jgi:threonyl-tRNA synthetase